MEETWAAFVDSNYAEALFPTAKDAYMYLLDVLSDHYIAGDSVEREYWEKMAKDLTVNYHRNNKDFSCDYCRANLLKRN